MRGVDTIAGCGHMIIHARMNVENKMSPENLMTIVDLFSQHACAATVPL